VDGVEVAVAVREEEPGRYRVSLRSNGSANVSAVCGVFGGGGHRRAAGCTLESDDMEKVLSRGLKEIRRRI
jgi:phosphoesterase RecJ-like protein